jgi:hypothetical protein
LRAALFSRKTGKGAACSRRSVRVISVGRLGSDSFWLAMT